MSRKRRMVDEMGGDAAMNGEKVGDGMEIGFAKDNCYVESVSLCNSQNGVEERKLSRLQVGQGTCRIGLASGGTPFWFWAVSSLGQILWIDTPPERLDSGETGSEDWSRLAIAREERLTKNRGSKKARVSYVVPQSWDKRADVDLVFFDGGMAPGPGHPVWKMGAVKVVCWIGGRKGAGPFDKARWNTTVLRLPHDELGGVTTQVSMIHVAERNDGTTGQQFVDCWRNFVESGLRKTTMSGVVDCTVHGRQCKTPPRYEPGVYGRTLMDRKLNWKTDHDREHVLPCVFSRTDWVQRKLSPQELAIALDFPADLHKRATAEELGCWIHELKVPFKCRVQVALSLRSWLREEEEEADDRRMKREREKGGERMGQETLYRKGEEDSEELRMTETEALFSIPDSDEGVGSLNVEERREDRNLKATKADDAAIPTYLWDDRICAKLGIQDVKKQAQCVKALEVIRCGALRYWKQLVCSDFWRWWRYQRFDDDCSNDQSLKERTITAGLSALAHASEASWWDWDKGLSPFFWRIRDAQWLQEMRDGVSPMWIGDTPAYRRRQRANPDEKQRAFETKKLPRSDGEDTLPQGVGLNHLRVSFRSPRAKMIFAWSMMGPRVDSMMLYSRLGLDWGMSRQC